ncbi:protein translocase subunit SecF [Ruminococcaceae bacterium OttesenSCG-928-D13]|nr:protein translocase subunit SecF [Ruminococcaceae bacterium OttesenSCG-928-D13]
MKRKGKIWFFVVAVLIVFIAVTTITGVSSRYGDIVTEIVKPASEIRFGIDIQGGVDVTFVPDTEEAATEDQMSAAEAVIKQRLIGLNVSDYELYKDVSNGRIILRFPWQAGETEFNPEVAIQELSTAALLTFREGYEVDDAGVPTGVTAENIILEGNDVENAQALYGPVTSSTSSEHYISLTLSSEGQAKFAEATASIAGTGGTISIWMDDTLISNPTVNEAINSTQAVITGSFTAEDAKSMADKINAGALPFALRAESYSTISPTLGAQSLRAMVIAGIIALILIVAFMIFNYRLPGLVSSISLVGQTATTIAFVSGYFAVFQGSTLTLPGIAGIILAIGMGVDANVITGERIKEELRSGKKLDAAIKAGFDRGLSPIIDSNVTVLIVAAILMGAFGPTDSFFGWVFRPIFFMFGPSTAGTIYSFGFTLLVGVLLNFVYGVFATRVMLKSISKFNGLRNPVIYGGLRAGQVEPVNRPFNIVGSRRKFFTLSGALIVIIVACSLIFGVGMDVQFRGGSIITYGFSGSFDMEAGQAIIEETLGSSVTLQEGSSASGGNTLTITMPGTTTVAVEELEALTEALDTEYPSSSFEQLEVSNVEASIGQTFLVKCLVAVLAASVLILIYVAFRFRKIGGWRGGLTAVVALVHDLIIVFGVFVVLRIPLSGNFIAVLLTILGYSINDTVVIYDRVRENRQLYSKRKSFSSLVNLSINQSLKRSVNTTVTTLMSLACVCIFALVYGLNSIFTFAFPMMIGMISGVYSTICIAGPLWVAWENKRTGAKDDVLPGGKRQALTEGEAEAAEKDAIEAAPEKKNGAKKNKSPQKAKG